MSTISTAEFAVEINQTASTSRLTGHQQKGSDERLFSELLEAAAAPERSLEPPEAVELPFLRHVDFVLGESTDLENADRPNDEQLSAELLVPAGSLETAVPTLTPAMEPMPVVRSMPPDRALLDQASNRGVVTGSPIDALAQLTAPNVTGTGTALETMTRVTGAVPLAATQSAGAVAWPFVRIADRSVAAAGFIPTTANPSRTSPLSVRTETHLIAAEGPSAAVGQLAMTSLTARQQDVLPVSSDPQSAAIAAADVQPIGPAARDVETISAQIAGPVSAAAASLMGTVPAESGDGGAPMRAANPVPVTAPDVVKALRFDLNPAGLGDVHVRLSLNQNGLRVHLSFSADKAAGLAQAERPELMQALSTGGMNLSQLVIDTFAVGKAEPMARADGPTSDVATSSGSMSSGSGDGQKNSARQEQSRTHPVAERYPSMPGSRDGKKAGLFI